VASALEEADSVIIIPGYGIGGGTGAAERRTTSSAPLARPCASAIHPS
jgi:NAD/NADP transhydrogenase beta subunit